MRLAALSLLGISVCLFSSSSVAYADAGKTLAVRQQQQQQQRDKFIKCPTRHDFSNDGEDRLKLTKRASGSGHWWSGEGPIHPYSSFQRGGPSEEASGGGRWTPGIRFNAYVTTAEQAAMHIQRSLKQLDTGVYVFTSGNGQDTPKFRSKISHFILCTQTLPHYIFAKTYDSNIPERFITVVEATLMQSGRAGSIINAAYVVHGAQFAGDSIANLNEGVSATYLYESDPLRAARFQASLEAFKESRLMPRTHTLETDLMGGPPNSDFQLVIVDVFPRGN